VTAVSKLSPLEWIEARLTHLSPTADRELVLKHAGTIFGAVVGIKASQPAKLVHGIRVRVKGRPKRVGTRDELQALRAAANKAVASERLEQREFWAATWIDTSEETRRAIEWDARTAVGEERAWSWRGRDGERSCVLPLPTDALPLIDAALKHMQAIPGAERRKRRAGPRKHELDAAMAEAVIGLLGQPSGDRQPRRQISALTNLALDVDAHFKLMLYTNPKCLPVRDLRALFSARASLQGRT
jgi:hypothetical protein